MTKIIINGADGRMGRELEQEISQDIELSLGGKITATSAEDSIISACEQAQLIVDFSTEEGTSNILNYAQKFSLPLLIGTTKLTTNTIEKIETISQKIPIIYAANTSIGANLINYFATKLATLVKNYDVEIIEKHHRNKLDAPSGTALMIGEAIAQSRALDFSRCVVLDRAQRGKRLKEDISFSSVRGGNIYGEHEVIFAGETELITLTHQATSRLAFAQGAILAAKWLIKQPKGLYSMYDVFDL